MADFFVWGNGGQKVSQDDIEDQLRYGDQLTQQSQQTPAYNWAQGAANMLNAFTGGFEHSRAMRHQTQNDDYNQEIIKGLFGGGDGAPSLSGSGTDGAPAGDGRPTASPVAHALATQPDDVSNAGAVSATPAAQRIGAALVSQNYLDRVAQVESGGSATAKNPNSTALGPYQFTDGTWQGVMQQHPELGLTADGRTDPQQARAAAGAFTADNANILQAHGIPATDPNLYAAAFLGGTGASRALSQDPSTPMASLVSDAAIKANPMLANMTVGGLQNWTAQKMGQQAAAQGVPPGQLGAAAATALPQAAQMGASARMQPQQGPSMQQLMAVMNDPRANSQTKATVGAMMQNQLQGDLLQRQIQLRQSDPLYQAELNDRNAEAAYRQSQMAGGNAQPQMTTEQQNLLWRAQQAGYVPGTPQWSQFMATGGAHPLVENNVTTGDKADAAYQTTLATARAKRVNDAISGIDTARSGLDNMATLESLNDSLGSGAGAVLSNRAAPYLSSIGIKVAGQPDRELAQSIIQHEIQNSYVPGTGAQTDRDAARMEQQLPTMWQTPQGRMEVINYLKGRYQNKVQAGMMARDVAAGRMSQDDYDKAVDALPSPYQAVSASGSRPASSAPTVSNW